MDRRVKAHLQFEKAFFDYPHSMNTWYVLKQLHLGQIQSWTTTGAFFGPNVGIAPAAEDSAVFSPSKTPGLPADQSETHQDDSWTHYRQLKARCETHHTVSSIMMIIYENTYITKCRPKCQSSKIIHFRKKVVHIRWLHSIFGKC